MRSNLYRKPEELCIGGQFNTSLVRFKKTPWLYTIKMYKQTHIRVIIPV